MENLVYHASPKQGLEMINPLSQDKNNIPVVCAAKDEIIASLFLGREGRDYTCSLGRDRLTGNPYLVERFEGAFKRRYDLSASIYELPSEHFFRDDSCWDQEVISYQSVKPTGERKIENAGEYLLQLESDGKIQIYLFPKRIATIPDDDSDLIMKAVDWAKVRGIDFVLKYVGEFHPSLIKRIEEKWSGIK